MHDSAHERAPSSRAQNKEQLGALWAPQLGLPRLWQLAHVSRQPCARPVAQRAWLPFVLQVCRAVLAIALQ